MSNRITPFQLIVFNLNKIVFSKIIPDVNVYQQKKTLAQGMMDLALLSANANQLRYVLEAQSEHPYKIVSLVFIAMSIILQVSSIYFFIFNDLSYLIYCMHRLLLVLA